MQDPQQYVRNFQEEITIRNKHKQPLQYPDDLRLHERPRVRKIEPPSQIISQSLLKSQSYVPDSLKNFTKPLINYQIISPSGKYPQRYLHNFQHLGQGNIFSKEPETYNQKDYKSQKYSQQSNEQRINYQNVGNMLISYDNQSQQQSQTQQQNQQMTQSQLQNKQSGQSYHQSKHNYQYQEQQQQQQQINQQQQQQLSQSQLPQQQYQAYQIPTQNYPQNQSQQLNIYQAGTPNTYKLKSDNIHQPFNYYGSRALKNLDSTQIY